MNLDEALAVIERFFLDVIGTVFAGAFFIFLVAYYFHLPIGADLPSALSSGAVFLLLGASYALGHFLTYVGSVFVEPFFRTAFGWIRADVQVTFEGQKRSGMVRPWTAAVARWLNLALGWTDPKKRDETSSLDSAHALAFAAALRAEGYLIANAPLKSFNELRNLALSVEGVDKALVYRFQFLGLFNLTTAAAVVTATFLWATTHVAISVVPGVWSWFTSPMAIHPRPFAWIYLAVTAVLAVALLDRSARFYGISMRIPVADALLHLKRAGRNAPIDVPAASVGLVRIYLAGGFQSGWQDKIRAQFAGRADFIDPRKHQLTAPQNYTAWDLKGIEASSLVFAYLERTNPGGFALALEVGYAKGLGKIVIYADEGGEMPDERSRYLEMIRSAAHYCCPTLDDGIKVLDELVKQKLA